jgi:multidrug efflux pump subunit AcrB
MSQSPTLPEEHQSSPTSNGQSQRQDNAIVARNASPLARFFILKPIFGILLSLLFIIGGVLGYFSMVKESNPDIDIAAATVTTTWAGADPETIEQQVTDELEEEISSVENLKEMKSASFSGYSLVSVEFTSEADVDESIQLLRDAVSQAEPDLPRDADQPVVEQVSVDEAPILTVALYGDLDAAILSRAAENLEDRLEQVAGVSDVTLGGSRDEVVQVQMNPRRLAALGISPTRVADQIRAANQDVPLGEVESNIIGTQVRFYGRFRTLEDLRELPIARLEGRVVRLEEIASVRRGLEEEDTRAFISTGGEAYEPVVTVAIKKVPGQDSIEVINSVLAAINEAEQNPEIWPYGMEYRIIADESETIWEQLGNLFTNALQAMAIVFVILFVALSWREALIAGLSIPLTFLGALAILWLTGQTLNIMVLIGMVLALGLLVDVFILMMEGMHQEIFIYGSSFNQAALNTIKTYAPPAFAGQLTTILALAPLMAITGTLGKFIRLLPITAIICLLLSFAIAILVDIPLSRFILTGVKGVEKKSRVDRFSEAASERFTRWSLNHTVRNKKVAWAWIGGAIALFVCAAIAFTQIPVTFFPESDQRNFSVNVELPPTTTLSVSQDVANDLGEILREKDYLESVVKYVGRRSTLVSSGELQPTEGSYLVGFSGVFLPEEDRENESFDYLDDLREELQAQLDTYPGTTLVLNAQQSATSEDPIQVELTGSNLSELRDISRQVQTALQQIPGATDVRDNLGALQPDLRLIPKREELSFYGISEQELANQARYYTRTNDVGDFAIGGGEEDIEIRLSTAWPSREGGIGGPTRRDELLSVRFFGSNPDQEVVSAGALIEAVQTDTQLSITHREGQRTVTVLAKTNNRTVGQILEELQPKLEQMQQTWPRGYDYNFAGETEDQAETFGSAGQALALAIFLVFAVLVLQFSSFRQPFIILLAIPFALIGTMGGFFLAWISFSFTAFIGIIALVGIVVNDAIVMVDTMNHYQEDGMTVRRAAAHGVSDRLRPVLTTSITTISGLIPLAFSEASWMPLCSAIIFGLIAATLSAFLIVPCLYLVLTPKTENSMS